MARFDEELSTPRIRLNVSPELPRESTNGMPV